MSVLQEIRRAIPEPAAPRRLAGLKRDHKTFDRADSLLPTRYQPPLPAPLPLHAHLQPVCGRSDPPPWTHPRGPADDPATAEVPSVSPRRLRPASSIVERRRLLRPAFHRGCGLRRPVTRRPLAHDFLQPIDFDLFLQRGMPPVRNQTAARFVLPPGCETVRVVPNFLSPHAAT